MNKVVINLVNTTNMVTQFRGNPQGDNMVIAPTPGGSSRAILGKMTTQQHYRDTVNIEMTVLFRAPSN